ncbi:hypothetical protein DFA_02544 [Cavenderia fasciculata]|uniref:ComC supersandwich domain-containing protein n=1 Tax=Cavenderia fasciculata TaxID=261658 RepID=F4PZP1_CACFS|nr:uncharacterized protein DFA_02544 [Cavenderia fasciculata]EGG18805.1 hypothetical protein DFA_02544 [Cavenderia fasciculata]|eukprot:XP_004357267.1 hypothetical protein DFA_02544 [Cavenderia fasciculata]
MSKHKCSIIVSQTQQLLLPQQELDSAIYLIRQYGLSTPQDQSLCNDTLNFVCGDSTPDGFNHIIQVKIISSNYLNVGVPDDTMTDLYFPRIKVFNINVGATTTVANTSMGIVGMIKQLKTLSLINIVNDPTCASLPDNFTYFPQLVEVVLSCPNLVSIPYNFLNNSVQLRALTISMPIQSISIDDTLYFPSLETLTLGLNGSVGSSFINITSKSYPKLSYLNLKTMPNSVNTIYHNIWSHSFGYTSVCCEGYETHIYGQCNLLIGYPAMISELTLVGPESTLSPVPSSDYALLQSLTMDSMALTQFPITAPFPPLLSTLSLKYNHLTSLLPIPPTVTILDLQGNEFTTLDENILASHPGLDLNLQYNTQFDGPITDLYCAHTLNVIHTGVTSLPDCYWCYINVTVMPFIRTILTPPPNFVCNVVIDNANNINLGFGGSSFANYTLTRVIANKQIAAKFNSLPFVPTNVTLKLNSYPNTPEAQITLVEGGVTINQISYSTFNTGHEIVFTVSVNINPYFQHEIIIDSESCNNVTYEPISKYLTCTKSELSPGPQTLTVSNPYYNDSIEFVLIQTYPIISSASYDLNNPKLVSLFGYFGTYGQSNLSITINNTLDCKVVDKSQSLINCLLDQAPNYGLSSVQLQLDSLNTSAWNILYLRPPSDTSDTPQQQCQKQTSNCYGHGICNINGICQCQDNYNPTDNCLTKFITPSIGPIHPNTTDPTVSLDVDGIDFQFEVVSIQELDSNSSIVKELFISNYVWIVNLMTNNITTVVDYQLNSTLLSSSSSSSNTNSTLFESVSVLSTISFSTQARDIQFGDQQLHINANSIKLSVNITNWQYSSNLATLRVVFRTIINNDQTVEYDCNEKQIDPLSFDYLRVVKDDIQFSGRFIDVALSGDQPTYSKIQLFSMTQSTNNQNQSIALIGIDLSQCQLGILNPDLNDKSGCSKPTAGDSKSNSWKIAVGAAGGVVGAVVITAVATITIRKAKLKSTTKQAANPSPQ